ncbi:helix-turn-helix domain-containing protein [Leptolyngbya sp. DQ-M1]|uniref:helix-turn-helix domain-containing protein n=1 Tax=Leptolyngbya sp. DQ-M1 TaxID=2933920 RepID=UPI00329A1F03
MLFTPAEICGTMTIATQSEIHWVRKMREDAGLTQEKLAVAIGVCVSTLRKWERGQVEPSLPIQQWVKFASAVNVPFEELPVKITNAA